MMNTIGLFKNKVMQKIREFHEEESGMGTVEVRS